MLRVSTIVMALVCSAGLLSPVYAEARKQASGSYDSCMEKYRKGSSHLRAQGVHICLQKYPD